MMPMVSQSFSTSLMMWVEKMTVLPLSRHSRMKAVMVRAVMMSRPLVGSSKIMTGGSWTRVRAMEVFCFMPVESLSQRRSRKPFISRRLKMLSTRFFGVLDDVVAADDGGAVGGLENGGEHAESSGFAGAIGSEETVNLAGLASKADIVDGTDFTALLVLEAFG